MRPFKTISDVHAFRQLPAPQHPLISVIDVGTVPQPGSDEPASTTAKPPMLINE